jgi:hypothetical protein
MLPPQCWLGPGREDRKVPGRQPSAPAALHVTYGEDEARLALVRLGVQVPEGLWLPHSPTRLSKTGASESSMGLLINLVLCLVAAAAIASSSAAVVFLVAESAPKKVVLQHKGPKVGPRVQAWLDRKAEELAYAERENAAALAEKERVEALRVEVPPPAEGAVMARAPNAEEDQAARLKRAMRARQVAKQEAKRRLRLQQTDAQRAYGYAPERRWSSYPDEFLTRRDRYGY